MENSKIIFAVEDIQVIQDATEQLARIRLKIARAGPNLHHLPLSENGLTLAAPTLKNKPILCHIIKNGTAMGGHEEGEQPIGFLDEQYFEEIDGERWQCATALIWKVYFPDVISIFSKSKDNCVSVSMEISVLAVSENNKKETVIEQFEYFAITLIGVTPAIPLASATMIEFSKAIEEYEANKKIFGLQLTHFPRKGQNKPIALQHSEHKEFDFEYATSLKIEYPSVWSSGRRIKGDENFEMWSKTRSGETSDSVRDWIVNREQYGHRHSKDKSVGNILSLIKWGLISEFGIDSMKSVLELEKQKHDNKNKAYFEKIGGDIVPYSKLSEINPSLKGIDPPISLAQANSIAKQADAIGGEFGWPTAIKSFKDRHTVKDGKWVEKDKKEFEKEVKQEMTDEIKEIKEVEKVEMASPPSDEGKKETPEEEKKEEVQEPPEVEKKEEEKPAEKKFALAEFADIEKLSAFMVGEEFEADFAIEAGKESDINFGLVVKYMFSKMCKMQADIEAIKKDKDAYMSKYQEYEAKFAEIEKQKFSIAVESLLKDKDISESLSKDEVEECRADAVNFSLETISGWENKVKALAFTHSKGKKIDTVLQYALPFHDEPEKSNLLFK